MAVIPDAYCPRCERRYFGGTQALALAAVREHLVKAFDPLHDGALEEWDDESTPVQQP